MVGSSRDDPPGLSTIDTKTRECGYGMSMIPDMADVLIKVALALFGVVAGALLKALTDLYRLRALLPIVTRQIQQAVSLTKNAFGTTDLKIAEPIFEMGFRGLSELVALGVRPAKFWLRGTELLFDASVTLHVVLAKEGDAAIRGLEKLRADSANLEAWLKGLDSRYKPRRDVF
jgi:hypothetical protein